MIKNGSKWGLSFRTPRNEVSRLQGFNISLNYCSRPRIPIHIVKQERIKREHDDYINRIEILFTINPRPHPSVNANTNVESIPSLPIPIQDNDSQREEIDIITSTDDVLPPGVENDNSDREVDVVDDLRVDNSISNSEHEISESEESDFDNPLIPLPPLEPPNEEFDFEIDFEDEILVVRNTIVEFECIDARVKFDVSKDENDDLSYFIFVKVFSLLSAESEDTIFNPASSGSGGGRGTDGLSKSDSDDSLLGKGMESSISNASRKRMSPSESLAKFSLPGESEDTIFDPDKVDYSSVHGSEDEVEPVDNEMASYLASKSLE
nr:hypothetical protein [Tanacetum cinerariifolium]